MIITRRRQNSFSLSSYEAEARGVALTGITLWILIWKAASQCKFVNIFKPCKPLQLIVVLLMCCLLPVCLCAETNNPSESIEAHSAMTDQHSNLSNSSSLHAICFTDVSNISSIEDVDVVTLSDAEADADADACADAECCDADAGSAAALECCADTADVDAVAATSREEEEAENKRRRVLKSEDETDPIWEIEQVYIMRSSRIKRGFGWWWIGTPPSSSSSSSSSCPLPPPPPSPPLPPPPFPLSFPNFYPPSFSFLSASSNYPVFSSPVFSPTESNSDTEDTSEFDYNPDDYTDFDLNYRSRLGYP